MEDVIQLSEFVVEGYFQVEDYSRVYPYGSLASHVLGYANKQLVGVSGIEKFCDEQLTGVDGYKYTENDVKGRVITVNQDLSLKPTPGNSVQLTINKKYQKILETEVRDGLKEFKGKSAMGIIMNPNTGEILASTNQPDYDPKNYNVPEGSFSSDPYMAEVRIKEFKEMVKAFHDRGIGVVLDVVYNHTGGAFENSNFNLEAPGYYYRHWEDGRPSDASACGNETASEKEMMRKFILESVSYWAKEYHLDGFRFDLMGIHDIITMNEVAKTLKKVNPNIFVYGEGWTAGDSPLPASQLALKKNITKMPQITAFSDDIRDGLKGSVFEDESTGFVSGAVDSEESVKMGIVGCIEHPQIDYQSVNYSDAAWTIEPWQSISYVSCHDNHTLYDKLKVSRKDADEKDIIQMDKLANAVVMTSQGTAFMHAGAEMLRTKKGHHNSYNLPDSINQIDWNLKVSNAGVVDYYKNLIALRKQHPAFRMTSSEEVKSKLEFKKVENGLISFQIKDSANGDIWKNIYVVYNAKPQAVNYDLQGEWEVAVLGDDFFFNL